MANEWWVHEFDDEYGPIDDAGLKFAVKQGAVKPTTKVRLGTDGEWMEAQKIKGLFKPVAPPVPPVPPKPPSPPKKTEDSSFVVSEVAFQKAVTHLKQETGRAPEPEKIEIELPPKHLPKPKRVNSDPLSPPPMPQAPVIVSGGGIRRGYCPQCKTETIQALRPISHLLHLAMSVITMGLWIPVWIVLACSPLANCTICGSRAYSSRISHKGARGFQFVFWSIAVLILGFPVLAILMSLFRVFVLGKKI